jgi:hypothetical protein
MRHIGIILALLLTSVGAQAQFSCFPQGVAPAIDDSDAFVPDVYYVDSAPYYWTGDALWPLNDATGLSALPTGGDTPVIPVYYYDSSCTGPAIYPDDGTNRVFRAVSEYGTPHIVATYKLGAAVPAPTGDCHYISYGLCVYEPCITLPWREAIPAGTPPDVSAYDMPIRPAS